MVVLVQYGIGESQQLMYMLSQEGYDVIASVRTDYGAELSLKSGASETVMLTDDAASIEHFLQTKQVSMVVDASHPFHNRLSQLFQAVCERNQIHLLRFYRKETQLPKDNLIHTVFSWDEAARKAAEFEGTIFVTTGSNNLDALVKNPLLQDRRIVVRVLPEYGVLKRCHDLGISPRNIVALYGPFSVKFNKVMFQVYEAGVIVTRDGGIAGGTHSKVKAALSLKIPVVLLRRGALDPSGPESCRQVLSVIKQKLPLE